MNNDMINDALALKFNKPPFFLIMSVFASEFKLEFNYMQGSL